MKKLFTSVIITAVCCLASCSAPMPTAQRTENNLDCAFTSDVTITLDKLTAEGNIKRTGVNQWEIEFSSPNTLSGVNLVFNQGTVDASYKGLSFSVPKSALPVKAMLVNLIEAVEENAVKEELNGKENEGFFELSGSLDGGEYLLTVDNSGKLKSFDMPNNLLEMDFTNVAVSEIKAQETDESAPETTAPETSQSSESTTAVILN